ncbi:unnamed protein product [Litomosoides sigmodontis]|uniref:Uncharacterized protein n=1 Tax=Litomosoides sigmodontis TaxID=42156 RepID=A0A3P6TFN8_LITSI|nr:unnamed protein product [Litomosoides sigmodontis]
MTYMLQGVFPPLTVIVFVRFRPERPVVSLIYIYIRDTTGRSGRKRTNTITVNGGKTPCSIYVIDPKVSG